MTDSNYTHITMVVDRSGSMTGIKEDAEGGINALIENQKVVEGKLTFTLVEFDDVYHVVHDFKDIKDVTPYKLAPRNMTALLDAVGRAVNVTGERLAALPEDERPSKVMVVIVTDGMENASREFSRQQIREMIEHQTNTYNWDFTFIGADINAFEEGAKLGIANNVQYARTKGSARAVYAGLSSSINEVRLGNSAALMDNLQTDYSNE